MLFLGMGRGAKFFSGSDCGQFRLLRVPNDSTARTFSVLNGLLAARTVHVDHVSTLESPAEVFEDFLDLLGTQSGGFFQQMRQPLKPGKVVVAPTLPPAFSQTTIKLKTYGVHRVVRRSLLDQCLGYNEVNDFYSVEF